MGKLEVPLDQRRAVVVNILGAFIGQFDERNMVEIPLVIIVEVGKVA